jgi:hypothetical protein
MKFKLKLLQIKCHVLEFTKNETQKMLQRTTQNFAESFISHDKHTLFSEPNPYRFESPTDSARRRHRKKEEDPYLHTNILKQQK